MRILLLFYCFSLTVALAAPAVAADSAWSGTWKVDYAKSNVVGDTFTYSKGPNGMIRYTYGTISYDYACDGKMYPTLPGFGQTCEATSANVHDFVNYANGKKTGTGRDTLSDDGKTITGTNTTLRPDGSSETTTTVFERVSGTGGWFGTWKSTKTEDSSPATMVLAVTGRTVTSTTPWDRP